MAAHRLILARNLDGAFHRLGAGIAEEGGIGEGTGDEALRQLLLAGYLEQI